MSKGFDIPSNKHLGNSHDYWKAPQKNSKQIVVQPLQWLPIDRDENGFATEECWKKIEHLMKSVDILFRYQGRSDYDYYIRRSRSIWTSDIKDIKRDTNYTHYFPIPKLEV